MHAFKTHRQLTKYVQNDPNTKKQRNPKMQSINTSQKAKTASALHPSKNCINLAKHVPNNAHHNQKKKFDKTKKMIVQCE